MRPSSASMPRPAPCPFAAPDYENPTDAGGNNVYDVTVRSPTEPLIDNPGHCRHGDQRQRQCASDHLNGGGATAPGQHRRERDGGHHRHRHRSRCRLDADLFDRRRRRCRQVHRRCLDRRAVVRLGPRLREPDRCRRQQRLRRHRAGLRRHPDRHPGDCRHRHQHQRQRAGDHVERRRRQRVRSPSPRIRRRSRPSRRPTPMPARRSPIRSPAAPMRRSSPSMHRPARCPFVSAQITRTRPMPAATTSTTSPCRSPTAL